MKKEIKMGIKIRVNPEQSAKVQEIVFANSLAWCDNTKEVQLLEVPFLFIDNVGYLSQTKNEIYFLTCEDYEEISAELFISTNGTCIQEESKEVKLSEFLKQNLCYDDFISEALSYNSFEKPEDFYNLTIANSFVWGANNKGYNFWERLDTKWNSLEDSLKIYDMEDIVKNAFFDKYLQDAPLEKAPTEVSLSEFTNEFPTLGLAFTQALQEKAHEEFAKEYTQGIELPKGESEKETPQPEKPKKEYLIFVSGGKAPKVVHTTLESALVEAKRLSAKEIGKEVFIMKKIKGFKSELVVMEITDEKTKGGK